MSNPGNVARSLITRCAQIETRSALRRKNIFSSRAKWLLVDVAWVAADAAATNAKFLMKKTLSKILPLFLAGILQVAPLLRNVVMQAREMAPCAWGVILRIGAGAIGVFGFDAVSSASSIAISPSVGNTNGYTGTITYSGGHAGSVSAAKYNGTCLSASGTPFVDGLKLTYTGGNTIQVTTVGTSLPASNVYTFSITVYDYSGCSGLSDTRSTTLTIVNPPVTNVAPKFVSVPQSLTTQVGAPALFSAGATGNPAPTYYWYQGLVQPANLVGTGSSLSRVNVQLNNAGFYTVVASNSVGTAQTNCYLSVCQTAGADPLGLRYTNYWICSNALPLSSYITNVPAAVNTYTWLYNNGAITSPSTSGSNTTLAANQIYVRPASAGTNIFSIAFNSTVGGSNIVNQQYDSYWAFGVPPAITSQPVGATTNSGNTVQLQTTVTVQQNDYTNNLSQGYFWYKNATNLVFQQEIVGTNVNTSYTIPSASASDSGTYTVVVTNYWGAVTSAPAVVSIGSPPGFVTQPISKSALIGQNVSFAAATFGSTPLTFQWNKDNSQLSDGGVYAGTSTTALTLTSITANENGSYTLTVTNSAGSTNSNPATLSVASPPHVGLDRANSTVSGTTLPGITYVVQSTADLTAPVVWTPLVTNITDNSGALSYTNTPSGSQQFLRILFP